MIAVLIILTCYWLRSIISA